tara:strand:+ start:185 stop:508 length:324 start_codon:yes stop_codon:yes gene_type:complete
MNGIWVKGVFYKIEKDDGGMLGCDAVAEVKWNTGSILINPTLSENILMATLLHEAVHILIKEGGMNDIDEWESGGTEGVTNALSTSFIELIKNNKDFFKQLIKSLGE